MINGIPQITWIDEEMNIMNKIEDLQFKYNKYCLSLYGLGVISTKRLRYGIKLVTKARNFDSLMEDTGSLGSYFQS